MFGDLDWPLNASCGFVSISWASCCNNGQTYWNTEIFSCHILCKCCCGVSYWAWQLLVLIGLLSQFKVVTPKLQSSYRVFALPHFHYNLYKHSFVLHNWRAPWKNRISSTTMKLRKSFVKPVTRQNISSCLVLPPEIVMHDAFNVILWTSTDICIVVHDDLGWKNRTTCSNRFWRAGCSQLEYIDIRVVY